MTGKCEEGELPSGSSSYEAYDASGCTLVFDGEPESENRHGRVIEGSPFFTSPDRGLVELHAKAWLLKNYRDTVYLATDGRVYEWLRNRPANRWMSRYYRLSTVLFSHILFLVTYVIASQVHDYGLLGALSVIGVAGLYELLWRTKVQNELESAVACELLYVLLLVNLALFQNARAFVH